MAYIKKKSERKFKITVCNGYTYQRDLQDIRRILPALGN